MPVAKGPTINPRGAILAGLLAVGVAALIVLAVLFASDKSGSIEVDLGDKDFRNINAARLAESIRDDGPVPFSDLVGSNRVVWVHHLGFTSDDGWITFWARVPDNPECPVEWNRDDLVFFNTCDPGDTYPETALGLEMIPNRVVDGNLIIDINNIGETGE